MKLRFATNGYLTVLMPAFLVLVTSGCATEQVAPAPAPQVEPVAAVESTPAAPIPVIEPNAMDALQRMGTFLQTLKTFEVSFKVSKDEVLESGQKIMVDGTSELKVHRPNKFHFSTKSEEAHRDLQFFYDGKTFTIYGNKNKLYASAAAPETIQELLDETEQRYDLDLPFRDLFVWGTDKADVAGIRSAIYIGPSLVNDVPCDHYAFRNDDVDWQLWIEQGETPLPLKLVITTKQEQELPQYTSVMNWNLAPKFKKQVFTFVPPKDAYKIEFAATESATESTK